MNDPRVTDSLGKIDLRLNDPPLQLVLAKILTAIQIIFDEERSHWIATYYQNAKVKVYVSCFSGSLSLSIREMLVRLY